MHIYKLTIYDSLTKSTYAVYPFDYNPQAREQLFKTLERIVIRYRTQGTEIYNNKYDTLIIGKNLTYKKITIIY